MIFFKKIFDFFAYYLFIYFYKRIDYFDYKKLIRNFPIFSFSNEPGIIGNKCYGNYRAISHLFKNLKIDKILIEHGLYFGNYIIHSEANLINVDTIITFGQYRKDALLNSGYSNKNIICIGPYIKYSKHFKTLKELSDLKMELGKTILVFPLHNSDEVEKGYDELSFINEIIKIKLKYNYKTILISMFWLDIKHNKHQIYQNHGFTIVTAGHRNDPSFLSRLKDLIYLSDMTISNELGTHVGYCLSFNKPHYIYNQQINTKQKVKKQTDNFDQDFFNQYDFEKKLFLELFSNDNGIITQEQKNIVTYYWGI